MIEYCGSKTNAVVIGGGLLGLEAAYGLKATWYECHSSTFDGPYYGTST